MKKRLFESGTLSGKLTESKGANDLVAQQLIIALRNDKAMKKMLDDGLHGLRLSDKKDWEKFKKLASKLRLEGYKRGLVTQSVVGNENQIGMEMADAIVTAFSIPL